MNEAIQTAQKSAEDAIISGNLEMMSNEMMQLLAVESFGGTAGVYEEDGVRYMCSAANGILNRMTGEIIAFGNIQEMHIQKALNEQGDTLSTFTFRVAFEPSWAIKKILEMHFDMDMIEGKGGLHTTDEAKEVLRKTVERYNESLSV